jgi:sugar phosphate isomerase/epimerase
MLSMTSDFVISTGDPQPYLQAIAEAGFTHVHWCHEWDTDRLYAREEVEQIASWLREYGLGVTDLHGSAGRQRCWGSLVENERAGGVELVRNRMDLAAGLGTDVVIMHLPVQPPPAGPDNPAWSGLFRSLEELRPHAAGRGVRIAVENGDFDAIEGVLARFPPEYVGVCYDSGHGNVAGDGLARLERVKDRLISIHLHDNDGASDQHLLPFTGTVEWARLAGIIARSNYRKWVSLESVMRNTPLRDQRRFLREGLEAGMRLAEMIAARRLGLPA